MADQQYWSTSWFTILTFLSIIAIFVCGAGMPNGWNWAFVLGIMIFIAALIGKEIKGRWSGILIDKKNKMSLAQFQLVVWTLIVISAFLTMALQRIVAGVENPIDIGLPEQLWTLLGISTTSLVGTPLILSTKTSKKPAAAVTNEETKRRGQEIEERVKERIKEKYGSTTSSQAQAEIKAEIEIEKKKMNNFIKERNDRFGILAANEKAEEANFSEIFKGDEQGNEVYIDMAKVQNFFFTLIIAFSYMVLLFNLIRTAVPPANGLDTYLNEFPALSNGVVALLGISAAGFLGNKVANHTKTK